MVYVPNNMPIVSPQDLKQLAKKLDITLITPTLPGLTLLDNSHLSPESAERFSTEVFKELRASREFSYL